jgi:hypothetical protein
MSTPTQSRCVVQRTAFALNRAPKGPQKGNNLKLCSLCMVLSGRIPSHPEGGYTGMAGWTQALELLADQWLAQGSELKT